MDLPDRFNIADHFLGERLREGRGDRVALRLADGELTYAEVQALADRFGRALLEIGVRPEERVLIALPDGVEFVGALFGTLKIGAVVVMVNPGRSPQDLAALFDYSRAGCVVVDAAVLPASRRHWPPPSGGRRFWWWVARPAITPPSRPSTGVAGHRVGGAARDRRHPPGRRGDLALLGRHHRAAQGGGPDPPLVRQHHRVLRASGRWATPRTTSPCRSPSSTSATPPAPTCSFRSRSAPRRCSLPSTPPPRSCSSRSAATGRRS